MIAKAFEKKTKRRLFCRISKKNPAEARTFYDFGPWLKKLGRIFKGSKKAPYRGA